MMTTSPAQPLPSTTWRRSTDKMPILIAHRGAPIEEPENTLASFRTALEAGAQVIEMDVRTTADGELVIFHDPTLDRTSNGQGAVSSLKLADLRAVRLSHPSNHNTTKCQIPRLEEIIQAFPTAAMNIDLKKVASADVPQIFAWIRRAQKQPGASLQILLTSANAETQEAILRNNIGGEIFLGMGRDDVFEVLKAAWFRRPPIERLRGRACQMPAHLSLLGINVPLLESRLPGYLRSLECPLHVWWDTHGMVDHGAQLEKCKRWGVDGIFTNHIRKLHNLIKSAATDDILG